MKLVYNEAQEKKHKLMKLQVDNSFKQLKIQDLNNQNNVEMFTTSSIRGGKMFAAEQKIRELKTRVAKLNIQKLKISPTKIILKSAAKMNNVISEKYGLIPEEIETRSLFDEKFKTLFNFHRIDKTRQVHERLHRCDRKKYKYKRKKLRDKLNISEKVLVLVERIKKNQRSGNCTSSQYKILPILTEMRHFQLEKNKLSIKLTITGSKI